VQAVELVHKRPKLAVEMLQRILVEDRTNLDAALALLDAHAQLGDKGAMADEAVARIAVLVRRGRGRQAAQIYEHLRELGGETRVGPRLSATIVSALMDSLVKTRAMRSAEALGQSWYAAHMRDPDAWRVKEALSLLRKDLQA
jgi:hypothetical protein